MNQSDAKRSSVKLPENANDLVAQIQDGIAERLNGFRPQRAYVLAEAMRVGLDRLIHFGSEKSTLVPFESKKEPKKNNIQTDSPSIDFASKIEALKAQIGNPDLLARTIAALHTTRKAGLMADSVMYGFLSKLALFSKEAVVTGCERYLDRGFASEGKRENYLMGIIRGVEREAETAPPAPGGNGNPKPPDATIPAGYPEDIYNRKKFKWSREMNAWYPKDRYGEAETGGGFWKWQPGMTKGE